MSFSSTVEMQVISFNGIVHEFIVGYPCHPEMREIGIMLHSLIIPLLLGSDEITGCKEKT